jgi:hypothetical protein
VIHDALAFSSAVDKQAMHPDNLSKRTSNCIRVAFSLINRPATLGYQRKVRVVKKYLKTIFYSYTANLSIRGYVLVLTLDHCQYPL